MRAPRIYTEQPLQIGSTIALEAQASHHLGKVLRAAVGDPLRLFNGDGCEYAAEIIAIDKKSVTVQVQRADRVERESPLAIHLGLGISRGERMEFALQKATELGVAAITPLITERSGVRLAGERADKKSAHWRAVIISACEQSGRCDLPQLHETMNLTNWLSGAKGERKFVLHHRSAQRLDGAMRPASADLLIGPEGGLTAEEIAAAEAVGFAALSLGPRVLRTETAPLAALSILQHVWGDM